MSASDLIVTKIQRPTLNPKYIVRTTLLEKINAAEWSGARLFVVNAPIGFGKTALVNQWAESRKNVCWYRLDESDSEAHQFQAYFFTCLRQNGVLNDEEFASCQSYADEDKPNDVVRTIINGISRHDNPVYLVLDNLHTVKNQSVENAIRDILNLAPPNLRFVLIGRNFLGLDLSTFLSTDASFQIRADDLRFQPIEASQLLRGKAGGREPEHVLQRLIDKTEGWPILLQMTLSHYDNEQPLSDFLVDFTYNTPDIKLFLNGVCDDYLDEASHRFLKIVSILDEYNVPFASAVSGLSEKELRRLMDNLRQSSVFILSAGAPRQYRNHSVLREYFIEQNKRDDAFNSKQLYKRSFDWCIKENRIEGAITYALRGALFDDAIPMIESQALSYIQQGEFSKVQTWIQNIPEALIASRPNLLIFYPWALLHMGLCLQADYWLDALQSFLGAAKNNAMTENERAIFQGKHDVLRFVNAVVSDNLERATALLDVEIPACEEYEVLAGSVHNAKALTLNFLASKDLAHEHVEIARRYHTKLNVAVGVIYSYAIDSIIDFGQCRLFNCQNALDQAERMFKSWGITDDSSAIALIKIPKAAVLFAWNQTNEARDILYSYLPHIEDSAVIEIRHLAYTTLASILHAQGDTDLAFRVLDQNVKASQECDVSRILIESEYLKIQMLVSEGRLDELHKKTQVLGVKLGRAPAAPKTWDRVISQEILIWCACQLALNTEMKLASLLTRMIDLAARAGAVRQQLECMMLLAQELDRRHEKLAAIAVLEDILTLTEREEYLRIFHGKFDALGSLLRKILEKGDVSGERERFIRRVLTSIELTKESRPFSPAPQMLAQNRPASAAQNWAIDAELSSREFEVLRLLAAGLSNKHIGHRLSISTNTVRWHVGNILSKLNAANRTEAVLVAQDRELL